MDNMAGAMALSRWKGWDPVCRWRRLALERCVKSPSSSSQGHEDVRAGAGGREMWWCLGGSSLMIISALLVKTETKSSADRERDMVGRR